MGAEGHREPDKSPGHAVEIVFPDTVRDGGEAEEFLWKGLPNPSLVQRMGTWILGSLFMGFGFVFVLFALHALHGNETSLIGFVVFVLIAIVTFLYGVWQFRLGFRR